MTRRTITMLSNTGERFEQCGEQVRADNFYGSANGIHTIQINYNNFTGGFVLQGTLANSPQEDDWFDIPLVFNSTEDKIMKFPRNSTLPTTPAGRGDSGCEAYTFIGNFTFLRAKLVRDYLGSVAPSAQLGCIDRVLLSL